MISEWLRWKIAVFMDRYRDTCWADLVLWANDGGAGWAKIFGIRNTAGHCARLGEIPYCGKCHCSGLQYELGGPDW